MATFVIHWSIVRATILEREQVESFMSDSDHDGLRDPEEHLYHTNPYLSDSDNDGLSDGDEILRNQNPLGDGPLLVERTTRSAKASDQDSDGLSDTLERTIDAQGDAADSDGDGFPDGLEVENGYDPTGRGRPSITVSIPSLNIHAPVIWPESDDIKRIEQDLKKGVIHYPGTAAIGERGNSFVTGHSSDYVWQRGPYTDIFKNLPDLSNGDIVEFTYLYHNKKKRVIRYMLTESMVVYPDDPRLFITSDKPILTLVTCYPVGGNAQRIAWRGVME
ncbi:MAG: sortase [Patescibacteria group bacterium]